MTMNNENKIETFRTADLALAAALSVNGFVIEDMDKNNAHRAVFIFIESPELVLTIKQYWRGELKVNPQAYFNELKILKSRIYER